MDSVPIRYLIGAFIILVVAGLVVLGEVPWEPGLGVIIAVAAALGVYEGGREVGRREGNRR